MGHGGKKKSMPSGTKVIGSTTQRKIKREEVQELGSLVEEVVLVKGLW